MTDCHGDNVDIVIMKGPHEMVPGDKNIRLNFYLFSAMYVLLIISLEPLVDFVLLMGVDKRDIQAILAMNQNKVVITSMVFTIAHALPLSLIAWMGYRILTSAKLPPARMKLPFTVPALKGKNARMIGILLITLALLLISQDLVNLAKIIIK